MANLTWRHHKNRNEGSALISLNFIYLLFSTYKGATHKSSGRFFCWKCSACTASRALLLKQVDNGGSGRSGVGFTVKRAIWFWVPFSLKAPAESPGGSLFSLKWDTAVYHVRLRHGGLRLWGFWLSGGGFHTGAPRVIWRKPKKFILLLPLSRILSPFPTPVSSWPTLYSKSKSCVCVWYECCQISLSSIKRRLPIVSESIQ